MTELSLDVSVTAADNVLAREIEGDTVLLSMTQSEYYGLNPTGTRIWQLLQRPCPLRDVRDAMVAEFDVDPVVAAKDVMAVVQDLVTHGLARIVFDDQSPA